MNIADRFTLRVLRDGPRTSEQLATECGLQIDSMRNIMSRLHQAKQAHVSEWLRVPSGQLKGVWKFGPGVDAPRPAHVAKEGIEHARQIKVRASAPRKRHPTVDQIAAITGQCGPFACLIGQMGNGR